MYEEEKLFRVGKFNDEVMDSDDIIELISKIEKLGYEASLDKYGNYEFRKKEPTSWFSRVVDWFTQEA